MIKFLQSGGKATKALLVAMLSILCLGMVVYLIPGFMTDTTASASSVVATVGGRDIQMADVQNAASREVQQQMQQQRYPENARPFLMQYALQRALGNLIEDAEISYEADRLGLRVADEEVQNSMRTGPYAQLFFPGGKWIGQEQYERILQSSGATADAFERDIKMRLLKEKIFTTLVAGIDVSPAEVEQAFKEQNTKIKFDYAFLAAEDLQKQLNPPDAELKAFYTKNQDRYKNSVPEKRQIRYFVVDDKAVQNKVAVTPNDLQQYYTAHMDEYRTPERVKVRHILIKTPIAGPDGKVDQKGMDAARAKAEDILKQLKNGANFAELAKKYSEDSSAQDGGELKGWQTRDNDLAPEFKNAAFSLNKGQMSDLVQTNFGFHIIQVEDKEAALLKPFTDVKSQIEDVVNKRKIASALNEMADTAQTQARADGLDKAAAKIGAQVVQTNPIAQKDSLPGIGATPGFMRAVFGANEKSRPEIAPLSQGYAIFQITKIDPARLAPLEEIKDQVATDFKAEQINTLLPKKTAELADRAHALHDLRKAAQELGATVKTSDLVTRTATVSDIGSLSGQAAGEAFHLKPGEISGAINLGAKGVVIALTDRQEPSLGDEFAKAKDQTREQLRNRKQQQALNLFLANLRSRLEKEGREKINKNAMENLMKPRG